MRIATVHNDEAGAVIVIVTFVLIALIGLSALVIDAGALLVKRRQIVRAADAAALAAAQSCARTQGDSAAQMRSSEYAGANVNTPTLVSYQYVAGNCDATSGSVAVAYDSEQATYLTNVLGLDDSYDIRGEATAVWGPAGSGSVPPLVTSSAAFQGECDLDGSLGSVEEGASCNFWYSNDDLGSATWGWLSLHPEGHPRWGWDVPPNHSCANSSAADRADWLENPPSVGALNHPAPTYVCVDTGLATADWDAIRDLIERSLDETGDYPVLMFPVNDHDGSLTGYPQVDRDGNATTTDPDKYNVVGFVTLKVLAVYDGNASEVVGTPGAGPTVKTCPEYPQDHTFTRSVPTWDLTTAIETCLAPPPPTAAPPTGSTIVEPPTVSGPANRWTYDSGTDVLTYTGFTRNQNEATVSVTLQYLEPGTAGTPGVCGAHYDGKHQDKCLVTEWVGYTTTGTNPGGGADFGARPVQLVD